MEVQNFHLGRTPTLEQIHEHVLPKEHEVTSALPQPLAIVNNPPGKGFLWLWRYQVSLFALVTMPFLVEETHDTTLSHKHPTEEQVQDGACSWV